VTAIMQRYTVTIINDTGGGRPSILVPFQPSSLIAAFKDEIVKRAIKQNIPVTTETHNLTLHLQSQAGPTIDTNDVLSDVILGSETIFAVFSQHKTALGDVTVPLRTGDASAEEPAATAEQPAAQPIEGDAVNVRVVTPATAKQVRSSLPTFAISVNATLQQLHEQVALHLALPANFEKNASIDECNCSFARKLSDHHSSPATTFVIHSKSVVGSLLVASRPKQDDLRNALQTQFGANFEASKKVHYLGGELDSEGRYTRLPVVAFCAKSRHIPASARVAELPDESAQPRSKILDLHTTEMPIHTAAMSRTISETGLLGLCVEGVLDIFAVHRSFTPVSNVTCAGKGGVFRNRAYWCPEVKQTDRGIAMFLASLRVTASLLQDFEDDPASYDALLHAVDLMLSFPPALRTMHLLGQGKTPLPSECAALSHSCFHTLETFMPEDLIGATRQRLFEGSRLLFGFLLEKARSVKLHESQLANPQKWPYLGALQTIETRDSVTNEPIMDPILTEVGIVERAYFDAFSPAGLLASNTMQSALSQGDVESTTVRRAILGGGARAEVQVLCHDLLIANYTYADGGNIAHVIDESELHDLQYLAELCGRNKLSVHKPSQLTSAVPLCLTFDRNAHLAVYLGEQGCSEPGRSSLVFRPLTGVTETPDAAVVEQLIDPIIKSYESEGTAVFDSYGGATVRKLEAPDEILMFCVDCSASMRQATDFAEINEDDEEESGALQPAVEGEYFADVRYEDVKEELCKHESFSDMVAIIAASPELQHRNAATRVLAILNNITANQLTHQMKELARLRQQLRYGPAMILNQRTQEVKRQKSFYAGLRTHEQQVKDFLIYRAAVFTASSVRWTWSVGDDVPSSSAGHFTIPTLSDDLTEIPDEIQCPIGRDVMVDAVKAADGHNYSRHALQQWFTIRKSSPMYGTDLQDTSMSEQSEIIRTALQWIEGEGLVGTAQHTGEERPSKKRRSTSAADLITLNFNSQFGGFTRLVPQTLTLADLYKLAFRGLKARYNMFQLVQSVGNRAIVPSPLTIGSHGLQDEEVITIRIAEDNDTSNRIHHHGVTPGDLALVKVYGPDGNLVVSYWVNRYSSQSTASVQWKYWRALFEGSQPTPSTSQPLELWTDMQSSGDGLSVGHPHSDSTERLNLYLNRSHCFGHLGQEDVYSDPQGSREQKLVLKVQLVSPHDKLNEKVLSRLDVLKQMFEALINKILAYGYNKTHIGLVTFSSKATVAMPISHVVENFRRATNDMEGKGNTALFDALALAEDQVSEYGARYPNAKKRIICISDGVDTTSALNTAEGVAYKFFHHDVALDSICLGGEMNTMLLAISDTLGCYKFTPFSLANALAMCELECVLSLNDRPDLETSTKKSWTRSKFMTSFLGRVKNVEPTEVDDHTLPPHRPHPRLDDTFISLADASRALGGRTVSVAISARSNARTSRLMNEMRQIVAGGPSATYDVYVCESDMAFWLAIMQGPSGTPYEGGTFMIYLHAEERYPAFAPKARFVTRIKHPNVSLEGRICHSIFSRDYTTDTSMTRLLDSVYGMLLQAETSDPVNTTITLGYHHDQVEFNDEVREWTRMYARKTREEWKTTLLEGKDWNDGDEDGGEDHEAEDDEGENDEMDD
jgi:ubiquitin-protein ligase